MAQSRRSVLVSLLLPIYLPAGLVTTANTLLAPFLPLWLRGLGSMVKVPRASPLGAREPVPRESSYSRLHATKATNFTAFDHV